MDKTPARSSRFEKITRLAILLNALQILCALGIVFYALFSRSFNLPESAEDILVAIAAGVVIWGAAVDIRDAFITRRVERQRQMLEDAYGQLEALNRQLRTQRHDFKNHLQVVYSLTEMGAYSDVTEYVQRIYEDVQLLGSVLRTSVPAVNALLSAKSADCRERGIDFQTDIQSAWEDMRVPGWEMCRIIGNLVDNARDALTEGARPNARICVRLGETLGAWTLTIENNGPEIPAERRRDIFAPGFTTKGAGHGNGLSIVCELVQKYDGGIALDSNAALTRFSLSFPKPARPREAPAAD